MNRLYFSFLTVLFLTAAHAPAQLLASASTSSELTDAQAQWLRDHSFDFAGAVPREDDRDLEPLIEMIGDARIVSLGESTHGSRQIFQMKHRLVQFLARELGFTIFSIEACMPESFAVNDYVQYGEGDPRDLIAGMYFWTWNTEEVLTMVEGMHRLNDSGEGEIAFTGFDMQTPDVAMSIVQDFLYEFDPDAAAEVTQTYRQIRSARQAGAPFASATGSFPIEAARGKPIRFAGSIATEEIDGYAGLWWRADGPSGVLAFENMSDRGPRGTSDWQNYEVVMDVPEEATGIYFGMLLSGTGTAWFDDLSVTIDGELYHDPDQFDFTFDAPKARGFALMSPGYRLDLDADPPQHDSQSLRISRPAQPDGVAGVDAATAANRAVEIVDMMRQRRDLYAEQTDSYTVDWAIQNAQVVLQCMQTRAGDSVHTRDHSMAENVAWILDQNPDARIVLWAHNGHVARSRGWMGQYLDEKFGEEQVIMGFATGRGDYYAMGNDGSGGGTHPLQEPPVDSFEHAIGRLDQPFLITDLRPASVTDAESSWLHQPVPFRSIGALAMDQQFFPIPIAKQFDVMIWIKETDAAIQIRR